MIILANPWYADNFSLSGRITSLGRIISVSSIGLSNIVFSSTGELVDYPVTVETLQSLKTGYMSINNVSYSMLGESARNLNVTTASTVVTLRDENVILSAGASSFVIDKDNKYSNFKSVNNLFGAFERVGDRFVIGGSTLMFSDLKIQNSTSSWYDTTDNSLYWQSIVKWALNYKADSIASEPNPESFALLVLISTITGTALVVFGGFLYITGKEMKLFDSKLVSSTQPAEEEKVDKSALSKSQRKLQQRMKNSKK